MAIAVAPVAGYRELLVRENDGILVAVFWHSQTDDILLEYVDERQCEHFQTFVSPENAMHAFVHPNSYRP